MPAVNRLGDPISCGDTLAQGSGTVFINGIPASRTIVDNTAGHSCWPPTVCSTGSSTVFADNISLVMVGSVIVPHCCPNDCSDTLHSGATFVGSPNVFAES